MQTQGGDRGIWGVGKSSKDEGKDRTHRADAGSTQRTKLKSVQQAGSSFSKQYLVVRESDVEGE